MSEQLEALIVDNSAESVARSTRQQHLAGSRPLESIRQHWPEYAMEAGELGLFMISACTFALLLSHPMSPVRNSIESSALRSTLMALAMGLSAVLLVYSPWGQQSGAHMNPAFTLTFFRLGKIAPWDAAFYAVFQLAGGISGVLLASAFVGRLLADPAINYVVTVPGEAGIPTAFATEFITSFIQMSMVLWVSNTPKLAKFTGAFAGLMVAISIFTVGPLSGMSMNPARTLASAIPAHVWQGIWIYFTAPPLAMLTAAELYILICGRRRVQCAKMYHDSDKRCIFCEYQRSKATR